MTKKHKFMLISIAMGFLCEIFWFSMIHTTSFLFIEDSTSMSIAANELEFPSNETSILKPRAVVHVGPHKTGSTSLQSFLVQNTDVLKEDNYHVFWTPGPPKKTALLAMALTTTKIMPDWYTKSKWKRENILRKYKKDLKSTLEGGKNLIMSSEEFDRLSLNLTAFRNYLVPGFDVHIVMHYRRFYDWLVSFYNENSKNGLTRGPNGELVAFADWLSFDEIDYFKQIHAFGLNQRFGQYKDFNISIVNMHDKSHNLSSVQEFVCNHVHNATHACAKAKVVHSKIKNPSINLIGETFLVDFLKYHSIQLSKDDNRRKLILQKFGNMTEYPYRCPSKKIQKRLLDVSIQLEKALTPAKWYESEKGIQDLKTDFEHKMKTTKFCVADANKILKDIEWKDFFTDLNLEHRDVLKS